VRASDVYVGLIGLRYSSPMRGREDMSYTELEFVTAGEAGLPRLVFLLDDKQALPIPADTRCASWAGTARGTGFWTSSWRLSWDSRCLPG
jgi:hypothetical protein